MAEPVTLWVGISFSSCGACGMNALLDDVNHDRSPTWSDAERKGCGARFTRIGSSYGVPAERLQELRPDLEVIDLFAPDASLGWRRPPVTHPQVSNQGDMK